MLLPILASSFLAYATGLTAAVNDPNSHGVVGDALLSLDEAIRLGNGTLALAALSPSELARITGAGTVIEFISIDAATTPTIVLQSLLTDILGTGVHLKIQGTGMPTIQGGNLARVFAIRAHLVHLEDVRIVGGQVGIDARMAGGSTPATHLQLIHGVELDGQTVAGLRVHGSGTDESMVFLKESTLTNMPVGFLLDDTTAGGGMVMAECEHVHMDGVAIGCRVLESGAGGNMSMFNMFRSSFTNGVTLAEKRRTPGSGQQFMFRIVFTTATCTGPVLDIEGQASGLTMVHHHHSDFVTAPGQKALWIYPRTAEFDIHGSEMQFDGDVSIAANLSSMRIWQQNNRYRNGTVTFDVDGALPNLLWNHYENCSIVVPVTARSPVVVRNSQLLSTTVNSTSFLAPITLQTCLRVGGSIAGFTTEQLPAPAPFLGTTTVSPAEPQVGTSLQLATDLPFGIGLVWDFVISYPRPSTTGEPVRFYGDPATVIVLPAVVLFQSTMSVPIPNTASLAGLEFYVQGISLPLIGQSYAPAYHLPRGQLILLQP